MAPEWLIALSYGFINSEGKVFRKKSKLKNMPHYILSTSWYFGGKQCYGISQYKNLPYWSNNIWLLTAQNKNEH